MAARLMLLGIVLSALLLPAPAAPAPAAPAPSAATTWSGAWSTGRGAMTLAQRGAAVEGTYADGRGHLAGRVNGSALAARWKQAGREGWVVLTMKADGRSFSGRSNTDASPTRWSPE